MADHSCSVSVNVGCRLAVQVRSQPEKTRKNKTEPSDDESQQPMDEYYSKKNQSTNVLRYFIEADEEQLNEMQILLEWMKQNLSDYVMKRPEFLNEVIAKLIVTTFSPSVSCVTLRKGPKISTISAN